VSAGGGQDVALRRVGQQLGVAGDDAITVEPGRGGYDAIRGIGGGVPGNAVELMRS